MGKKLTFKEFEERINKIFNNTIDLNEFVFINTSTKGHCKCKICGYEWDAKGNTLLNGHGCRKCYNKRNSLQRILSLEEIQKRIYKNGNNIEIIDEYIDTKHKCLAKCNICKYEWRTMPSYLIKGHGCPKCNTRWTKNRVSKDEFIKKMNLLYNSEYKYIINNEYVKTRDFIKFICPIHGVVKQLVSTHIKGNGCKFCKESGLERKVRNALIKNDIKIISQYNKFEWLINKSTNHHLILDFYLPDYNIAIECQGKQHFEEVELFSKGENLSIRRSRDKIKKQLCKENNVKLIYYLDKKYITYLEKDDVYATNIDSLIKLITEKTKE